MTRDELIRENAKLRNALAAVIPWLGEPPNGPDWATPQAKKRNAVMFQKALDDACACFPDGYNGVREYVESN